MQNWHALKKEEIFSELNINVNNLSKGFSDKEAKTRLKFYGKNEIDKKKKTPEVIKFLKQFNSPLIYILILAMIISFVFDHTLDGYIISFILLLNASLGYVQERKAERAIEALKKMVVSYAKVIRNNELTKVPSSELVPGDIILLEEGDKVPADARLFEVKNFRTQESSLTGESLPVEKNLKILHESTSLSDRTNMVFMGTIIVSGEAKAIVVSTGNNSSIGQVAKSISEIVPPKLHFNDKIKQLTFQMASLAVFGALVIFIIGFFIRGMEFIEIFLFTLASLVSATPEGLPAVLIVVLAVGARRMAQKNAIIRHLPAIESMGVVTVIATDKTGTLTKNTLTVDEIYSCEKFEISGTGWSDEGSFSLNEKVILPEEKSNLKKILVISALSNKSNVLKKEKSFEIIGDPTEASLLTLSKKAGFEREELLKEYKIVDDFPFNSDYKFRASLVQKGKKKEIFSIGAFEKILENSSYLLIKGKKEKLSDKKKKEIFEKAIEMTKNGKRVLGVSFRDVPYHVNSISPEIVNHLVFVGIVGMRDSPREGVKEAIKKTKDSGIRVIMQTGDHKETALAIAREIGMNAKFSLTGEELEKLSGEEFENAVKTVDIFARVTPKMKLRIVTTLQNLGEVVAMTGDGVNDAPSLKKSDLGISMGVIGTDVARESSEMVLADDNFASIVDAIEEGRIVFRNVRQVSTYLVTTNVAEQVTIILAIISSLPLPLLPIHILWMNLVTDGFNGISLATEKSHGTALNQKPKKKEERILNAEVIPYLLIISSIMALFSIVIFTIFFKNYGIQKAMTGAFLMMTFSQFFSVLNARSLHKSLFKIGVSTNKWVLFSLTLSLIAALSVVYIPFLNEIFRFSPLSFLEIIIIFALASLVLIAGEIYKFVKFKDK